MKIPKAYLNSERMMRLSVDIDRFQLEENPFIVFKTYYALKNMFPQSTITVLKTKHGYHIKAVGKDVANLPIEKRIDIREALCDDNQRVEADRLKASCGLTFWIDTLFQLKIYPDGTRSIEENVNPIALPYVSKIPATKPISFPKS